MVTPTTIRIRHLMLTHSIIADDRSNLEAPMTPWFPLSRSLA